MATDNNNGINEEKGNSFMDGAIEVDYSDLNDSLPVHFTPQIKKELDEKIEDNSNKLLIDLRQIEKILGIKQNNSKALLSKKNVTFDTSLFEEIKLLSKYEGVPANKLIINAVTQYIEDRRHILDKIEEVRNAHAIDLKDVLEEDKED